MIFAHKMPHSTYKKGFQQNPNLGMGKCSCGQTFDFASERDLNVKLQMHRKFCSNPPKSYETVRLPKKAMTMGELQHYEAERIKRVHKYYLSQLDKYYHF